MKALRVFSGHALFLMLALLTGTAPSAFAADPLLLWYDRPASDWNEALPLGNGRLAAMVFGGIQDERIQINENTLWAGGPHDYTNPEALKYLARIRELVFQRNPREAEQIADRVMGVPKFQQPYQPFCDLLLHFPETPPTEGYRRQLDLDQAIESVAYRAGGVNFRREIFISHPDQVIVIRLAADQPERISFDAALESPQPGVQVASAGKDTLRLYGQLGTRIRPDFKAQNASFAIDRTFNAEWRGPGIKFQGLLHVRTEGGTVSASGTRLSIRRANSAVLLFSGATSFNNYKDISGNAAARAEQYLDKVRSKSFDRIRRDHVDDYQRLFRRVQFDLGTSEAARQPTDLRLKNFNESDPQLAVLLYQFGRYLLISSSRPGGQPPTLQGMWNQDLWPVWSSKYTTNINLEMNYWPADTGSLPECLAPLFSLIDDLRVTGAKAAKVHYGSGGWVLHHNTDLWRGASPVDASLGLWPMGAAWLCQHLWDHYEFTLDEDFLRNRAYPAMKEAAQFFLDFLVEAPPGVPFAGYLVTNPSNSPEIGFRLPDGKKGSLSYAVTMDIELLTDLFERCAKAADILGIDSDFRARVEMARRRLPPLQIGRRGQLQEWIEDYEEADPHHRHTSHLYAVYPSHRITPEGTPELAAAARKSLELRGDYTQGWAEAWRVSLWASLKDRRQAFRVLQRLVSLETLPNLFSNCPPMQVDGSFGISAGITEMLLQSHGETIQLLPALPNAWPAGSIKGLRARGGIGVDLEWRNGTLTEAVLQATFAKTCRIRYGTREIEIMIAPGREYRLNSNLEASK